MDGGIAHAFIWVERHKALRVRARAAVEFEGGEVRRISAVGLFIRSPFPGYSGNAIYPRVKCADPNDRGFWWVRKVCEGGAVDWVWSSELLEDRAPIPSADVLGVNNAVLAVPVWLSVVVSTCMAAGLVLAVVLIVTHFFP